MVDQFNWGVRITSKRLSCDILDAARENKMRPHYLHVKSGWESDRYVARTMLVTQALGKETVINLAWQEEEKMSLTADQEKT